MTTGTRRDPRTDHFITPENSALLVIDCQPSQVASVQIVLTERLLQE
jgi:hypothetical protein